MFLESEFNGREKRGEKTGDYEPLEPSVFQAPGLPLEIRVQLWNQMALMLMEVGAWEPHLENVLWAQLPSRNKPESWGESNLHSGAPTPTPTFGPPSTMELGWHTWASQYLPGSLGPNGPGLDCPQAGTGLWRLPPYLPGLGPAPAPPACVWTACPQSLRHCVPSTTANPRCYCSPWFRSFLQLQGQPLTGNKSNIHVDADHKIKWKTTHIAGGSIYKFHGKQLASRIYKNLF